VGISFGNAFAQNTTDMYPNDTETIQEFEEIEGNNTAIFENNTSSAIQQITLKIVFQSTKTNVTNHHFF
jgi:hypothetical protein